VSTSFLVDTMTEKSIEMVEGLVVRAPPGGRRTYRVAAKRALVQMCLRPGVSVASTALAHGINANLLRRWMLQYGPGAKSAGDVSPSASLIPVNKPPAATLRVRSSDSCIEISFMGATIRVHGLVDARTLRAVLDCLAQRA
jgi:transposase-like protein